MNAIPAMNTPVATKGITGAIGAQLTNKAAALTQSGMPIEHPTPVVIKPIPKSVSKEKIMMGATNFR